MDVDISDILADVSRSSQSYQNNTSTSTNYDAEAAYTDYVLLTRYWSSERCIPSLLSYPTLLIERVMDRIRGQIAKIEDLTSGVFGSNQKSPSQGNLNLVLSILQTDLSRTQFLMRSYLRCRLGKITNYATYYSKYHVSSSTNRDSEQDAKSPLLSAEEVGFLQHHQELLITLYNSSFLLSLPPSLRRLDDTTGGSARMDEGPDGTEGVMVRCLATQWTNEQEVFESHDNLGTQRGVGEDDKATVELSCERGGILIARWRDVRTGVEKGDLEVL